MTNLETLASAAVLALAPGDTALDQAVAAVRKRSRAGFVEHVDTKVVHVDETACRTKGVLVRGRFQIIVDFSHEFFDFDAFVSFETLTGQVVDLVLDDENVLSFAA